MAKKHSVPQRRLSTHPLLSKKQMMVIDQEASRVDPLLAGLKNMDEVEQLLLRSSSNSMGGDEAVTVRTVSGMQSTTRHSFDESALGM